MNVNEALTTFDVIHHAEYEHWTHTLHNEGNIPVESPDFDISNLTYVVKLPEQLSHLLDDAYVLDYLFGRTTHFDYVQRSFTVTRLVIDEDGNEVMINHNEHRPHDYLSVNHVTNSIEFDFNRFYSENNLKPHVVQKEDGQYFFNTLTFQVPFVLHENKGLDNGTYEFKTAVVQGKSINLDSITNAHRENLVVIYNSEDELEQVIDKDELETLVGEANAVDQADYTEESFAQLEEVLIVAENVLMKEEVTEKEVVETKLALQQALEGLETVTPYDAELESEQNLASEENPEQEIVDEQQKLLDLVDKAKSYGEKEYTQESFTAFEQALMTAEAILADDGATEEDVIEAITVLQEAIDHLEVVEEIDSERESEQNSESKETPESEAEDEVDKQKLSELIDKVKNYEGKLYTEESFATFKEALAVAEKVLIDDEATEEEVTEAMIALEEAIDRLEKDEETDSESTPEQNSESDEDPQSKKEIDQQNLLELIAKAKVYEEGKYTEESFVAITQAIADAEAVLADDNVTKEDVTEVMEALQTAIENLEEVKESEPELENPKPKSKENLNLDKNQNLEPEAEVDKRELSKLIGKAKANDEEKYTKKTYQAFKEALALAEGVLADDNATKKDVTKAITTLQEAIDQLKTNKNTKNELNNHENSHLNEREGERLPHTATNNFTLMMIGSLLAVIGGVMFFIRRRLI